MRTARGNRVPRLLTALVVVLLLAAGAVAASELLHPRSFAGVLEESGTGAPAVVSSAPPALVPPAPAAPVPSPPPAFDRGLRSLEDPDSTWVVVNKLRPLQPLGYAPADLVDIGGGLQLRAEAARAVGALRAEAAAAGLDVGVQSAYRSFERQQGLFGNATARFGVAGAELRSARPGFSEHQTGLAVDVGGGGCDIERCFGDTPEGRWVVANAHRTGFLVRYPAGSELITGYQYEPWHLRYVGPELATEMHETGVATLEEFFGLPPAPEYATG
ncbi:D-alanyl-D-alanine carboxypeptidase [Blastococcus aurantiacus]|uniref:D-alanyl-D-alanine carboxypeptidase n=1 Tax=Blastococcus aurantiacus TaxID=1550231 RepID=A0A1G7NIA7_9ACTN|nr:M15 family metallopeptidase [Blastococcus aurantiacus]SDF73039.1 D-alanyl-D-alanine carboxypeptidase [Blastococcus aurantiacus]